MPAPSPAYANVAYLLIPRFAERDLVEQGDLKSRLEAWVRTAISGIAAGERIVVEATDGLALVLFGEPARAMDVASALAQGSDELPLHVGLNYGPLALTARGIAGQVFGDGLTAASAAARFASPHRLFVTETFAKALEAAAPVRAHELVPAGEFTDSRVRLHAFFTPDAQRGLLRQRRFSAYALTGILLILLLGVVGRDLKARYLTLLPAVVELDVKPRADVLVDDILQGRTPPLTEFEVTPGRHRVTLRNASAPPLELTLRLESGERVQIKHTFVMPPPPAPAPTTPAAPKKAAPKKSSPEPVVREPGFWETLRRKLPF